MSQTVDASKTYITKQELAYAYRISIHTLNYWIRSGKIKPVKVGRRALFDVDLALPNVNNQKQSSNV